MDKEFEAAMKEYDRRERDYWQSQRCIHCGRAEGPLNPQQVTRDLKHKICYAEREFDTTRPADFDVAWYLRDSVREFGWSQDTCIRMYHELQKFNRWTLINVPEWLLELTRKETAQPGQLKLFESEAQP
jgi:hypothetical protein